MFVRSSDRQEARAAWHAADVTVRFLVGRRQDGVRVLGPAYGRVQLEQKARLFQRQPEGGRAHVPARF